MDMSASQGAAAALETFDICFRMFLVRVFSSSLDAMVDASDAAMDTSETEDNEVIESSEPKLAVGDRWDAEARRWWTLLILLTMALAFALLSLGARPSFEIDIDASETKDSRLTKETLEILLIGLLALGWLLLKARCVSEAAVDMSESEQHEAAEPSEWWHDIEPTVASEPCAMWAGLPAVSKIWAPHLRREGSENVR